MNLDPSNMSLNVKKGEVLRRVGSRFNVTPALKLALVLRGELILWDSSHIQSSWEFDKVIISPCYLCTVCHQVNRCLVSGSVVNCKSGRPALSVSLISLHERKS